MTAFSQILPALCLLADQESTPLSRWEGVHRYATGIRVDPWWVGFWVLTAVVSCTLGVLTYRAIRRRLHLRLALDAAASGLRLTSLEREVLATLAKHSGLRDPAAVFAGGEAFEHAAAAVIQLPRMQSLPEPSRQQIRAMIESLRTRLGFAPDAGGPDGRLRGSRQIPIGEKLLVARAGQSEGFPAVVERNSHAELTLRHDPDFHARRGDRLVLQYTREVHTWELSALVIDSVGERIVLSHAEEARVVNRRRFTRVPVRREACIGLVPFHAAAGEADTIALLPATLIEMGGPGVALESPRLVHVGDCLILRVRFPDALVQALARVRRVDVLGPDRFRIGGEVVGLEPGEVAELVHRTHDAQLDLAAAAATAKTAVPAVGAVTWRQSNG